MYKSVVQPLEKEIEAYFAHKVKAAGGWTIKFQSEGNAGVPDRIVFWPDRPIEFAEIKRPGGKLRPLQVSMCKKISTFGVPVYIVDSKEAADQYIGGCLRAGFINGERVNQ
ncbi:MAG: VRR-NUC domain-containing protein [Eubacteriales bacterium]|nr:VRR-NUC domain-containing protein [Eubacteriales bacterium]